MQQHIDCVEDVNDFYERHIVDNIETHIEAQIIITKFEDCLGKLMSCHSKLRVALAGGYEDNYRDINEFKIKARNYLRDLEVRDRLLICEERLHSEKLVAETEGRNRALKVSLFQQKLEEGREERMRDRQHTEKIEIFRLEASVVVAQDAMTLEDSSAYSRCDVAEIEHIISEAKAHLKEFRVTNFNLSKILGDNYTQERHEQTKSLLNEFQVRILNLAGLLKQKRDDLDSSFKCQEERRNHAKVNQVCQLVNEIKIRCGTLELSWGVEPTKLSDSQLMAVSFAQLNKQFNQILDKATH